MYPAQFDYHTPSTVQDALALLSKYKDDAPRVIRKRMSSQSTLSGLGREYQYDVDGPDTAWGDVWHFEEARAPMWRAIAAAGPTVFFPIAPLMHGAGQVSTIRGLIHGDTTVLVRKFDAREAWQICARERVNVLGITGDAMARPLADALVHLGPHLHVIGGADVAAELDARRAIEQGSWLAAGL